MMRVILSMSEETNRKEMKQGVKIRLNPIGEFIRCGRDSFYITWNVVHCLNRLTNGPIPVVLRYLHIHNVRPSHTRDGLPSSLNQAVLVLMATRRPRNAIFLSQRNALVGLSKIFGSNQCVSGGGSTTINKPLFER